MAFEFIYRKGNEISQKNIRRRHVQVSINDCGSLCIREFDDFKIEDYCDQHEKCINENNMTKACRDYENNYKCEHLKVRRVDEENVIVFDKETTDQIIDFILSIRNTYLFKKYSRKKTYKIFGDDYVTIVAESKKQAEKVFEEEIGELEDVELKEIDGQKRKIWFPVDELPEECQDKYSTSEITNFFGDKCVEITLNEAMKYRKEKPPYVLSISGELL